MPKCPHCAETIAENLFSCPFCYKPVGAPEPFAPPDREGTITAGANDPENEAVAVARFHHAAEAGFFGNELIETAGIPARVEIEEHFDALSGLWSTRFVLLVPRNSAGEAKAVLEQLIERTAPEDLYFDEPAGQGRASFDERERFDPEWDRAAPSGVEGSVNWVPIVLTLAAGSAAFWGVRHLQEAPPAPQAGAQPVQPADLWERLSSSPEPWIQEAENGRTVRRIQFDRRGDAVIIREDTDGDGVFEREHALRRAEVQPQ